MSTPRNLDPQALGTVITDPRVRQVIYGTYVVAVVIAGAITVGLATLDHLPTWAVVMNSVLSFLGAPVGTLAIANTRTPGSDTPSQQPG